MSKPQRLEWRNAVAPFEKTVLWRSLWQVLNSLGPYLLFWYLAYRSLQMSYGITIVLSLVAAGFLCRCFIILHDCGHGAFFKSQKVNDLLGAMIGVLAFTPYHRWRSDHAMHHATCADLDRRAVGDIWTLTVKEYRESSSWKRFGYRLYRNPLLLFTVIPVFLFVVLFRFNSPTSQARERRNVIRTNLAIAMIAGLASLIIGVKAYLLVQLPIIVIASSAGVWLFYMQHQFKGVYWERHAKWDYVKAALEGCSFYKLPRVFQWFTGNIGFHHVHHMGPRIPNYFLEKTHLASPMFRNVRSLTVLSSLKSLNLRLWDEEGRELVGYGDG